MEKYGFVYLWYDRKHKKFYLGRHWGTEDDGYVCSSKTMREAHRRRPEDFKRRIISKVYDKQSIVVEEQKWLDMIKPSKLLVKYYNKTKRSTTPSTKGYKHSKETRNKISKANKGRKVSEETKKKISNAVSKIMTEEHRSSLSEKCSGWHHTNESKEKIREAGVGRSYSEESRRKIGAAQKGKIVSNETREKLRNAILGKKRGPYNKKQENIK